MQRRRRTDQLADRILQLETRLVDLFTPHLAHDATARQEIWSIQDLLPQVRADLRAEMAKRAAHRQNRV